MNGKYYIGPKVSDFERYNDEGPVVGVRVLVDNDNAYIAGDQTGYVIEVECPYGTQEMANNLLSSLSGITYKGYRANAAVLSPQAELGDGVDVNGLYSVLAYRKVEFGPGHMSEVAAPGDNEAVHEYEYTPQSKKELNYQLAQTRSLISKSAEEIKLQVEDLENGLSQTLRVAADGVTITNAAGDTLTIDGGQINASTIKTEDLDASKINAADLQLTGAITWSDLAQDAQNEIDGAYSAAQSAQNTASSAQQTAASASNTAASAYNLASGANSTVSAWTYSGTTYIDGSKLMTGTVRASTLEGGSVSLLNSSGSTVGVLTMTGASTADFAIDLTSYGALRLTANQGAIYITNGYGDYIQLYNNIILNASTHIVCAKTTRPSTDSGAYLGTSSYRWSGLYAATSTILTSDRNAKHDIEELPDKYVDMLLELPVSRFKLDDGTSDRYHVGYIAQDVEEYMAKHGIDSQEFGGFVMDQDEDGNDIYMLRYEEFIAIHTLAAQRHEEKIDAMGAEIENLKLRLEAAGL